MSCTCVQQVHLHVTMWVSVHLYTVRPYLIIQHNIFTYVHVHVHVHVCWHKDIHNYVHGLVYNIMQQTPNYTGIFYMHITSIITVIWIPYSGENFFWRLECGKSTKFCTSENFLLYGMSILMLGVTTPGTPKWKLSRSNFHNQSQT